MRTFYMRTKHFSLKRTLKIFFLCMIFFVSHLIAQNLREVKIIMKSESITLESALKYIEQNTKFTFTYNKETLPLDKKVQPTGGETSLYEVLYNLAKYFELTFHRISNQIVIKKADGNEKKLVTDEENNTIEGKVLDAKTNEPLAFVSVYLSGTSIGTITNEKGIYKIKYIPQDKYNLVASIVGYKAKIVDVEMAGDEKIKIEFAIEPTFYKFNQIDVSDEIPEKWRNQLKYFKKLFLGDNKFAEDCIIKNEYKINFYEDDNRFIAEVNEPLIIINNALGYKIEGVLKKFEHDKKGNKTSYRIYPTFKEIIPSTQDSIDNFNFTRKEAYFGSLTHLLTTLANKEKDLRAEGFELTLMYRKTRIGDVNNADEIVVYNQDTGQYFLKPNFSQFRYVPKNRVGISYTTLKIDYWGAITWISGLNQDGYEFDPGGYFVDAGFVGDSGFTIQGKMAKEGVAMMLPRFWKPMEDKR